MSWSQDSASAPIQRPAFEQAVLLLIGINLIGFASFVYESTGDLARATHDGHFIYTYQQELGPILFSFLLLTLGIMVLCWSRQPSRKRVCLAIAAAVISTIGGLLTYNFLVFGFEQSIIRLQFGGLTDGYLLQQLAAESILNGQNPYQVTYDLRDYGRIEYHKITRIYGQGPPYKPRSVTGLVNVLNYPAFAALYYIPSVALGIPGNIQDTLVLLAVLYAAYRRSDIDFQLLFPLFLLAGFGQYLFAPTLFDPVIGWFAPAVLAIVWYHRPYLAGTLLALATSYRPQAFVFSLFYFVAAYHERYDVKQMLLAYVGTGFLINIPFFLLAPAGFLKRISFPLVAEFRWRGFGLTSLHHLGIGFPKSVYTIVFALTLVGGLLMYWRQYDSLRYLGLIFPGLCFMLLFRSLISYYLWFPLLGVLALSTGFVSRETTIEIHDSEAARIRPFVVAVISVVLMSLLYLIVEAYPSSTPPIRSQIWLAITMLLIVITGISMNLRRVARNMKYIVITILSLPVLVAILGRRIIRNSYIIYIASNFYTDAWALQVLGARSMANLRNPYPLDYRDEMAEAPLGMVYRIVPYERDHLTKGQLLHDIKTAPLGETMTPVFETTAHESIAYHITFFNYPPGAGLFFVPSSLLNVNPSVWVTIMAVLTVVVAVLYSRGQRRYQIGILLFMPWLMVVLGFSLQNPAVMYVAPLLLAIVLYDYPVVCGILLGFAVTTKPQAMLFAPYWGIFYYAEKGYDETRTMVLSSLAIAALIFVPFLLMTPDVFLDRFLHPITAELGPMGIGLVELIGFGLPIPLWVTTPIALTVFAITWLLYAARYDMFREGGLTFPILVLWFFNRSSVRYMMYFPLFVAASYIIVTQLSKERSPAPLLEREGILARVRKDISKLYIQTKYWILRICLPDDD